MGFTQKEYESMLNKILQKHSLRQFRVFYEYGVFYSHRNIISEKDDGLVGLIVSEPANILDYDENKTMPNKGLVVETFNDELLNYLKNPVKEIADSFGEPAIIYHDKTARIYTPEGLEKNIILPDTGFRRIKWEEVFEKYSKNN